MKHKLKTAILLTACLSACYAQAQSIVAEGNDPITFQTHAAWSPYINLAADTAMVYGIDDTMPSRIRSWREHGYHVAVMTGVSWGEYGDYLNGKFDGKQHWDEAQVSNDGKQVSHGRGIPYMAPSASYGSFLIQGVQKALDAGAEAIYLEEPEFWAKSGWSESFKREWKDFYHEPWQSPDSSPDAQYRSSKLKYFLYRRTLAQVFEFVRDYSKTHNRRIPCYVATHSLINYAQWRIVSPESSLIQVGNDGYIAQVWTGTARAENIYRGERRERTFETAFLEYGAMQNLVRASGRRIWYLNDPIEDNPNHSWKDYRSNWESTLVASLLQPAVSSYEIVPWPERIFNPGRLYPESEPKPDQAAPNRIAIPKPYKTELQTVFRALGEMHEQSSKTQWQHAGTQGIGVLVSDTLMFQRAAPSPSDADLSSFYGLALPLLMRGLPVEPVQIEDAVTRSTLERYRVLLLTYEGQKPASAKIDDAIAAWVRSGGALVIVDDDSDPYNHVREWWNEGGLSYASPRLHLFEKLGIEGTAKGLHPVGKGFVLRLDRSPAALAHQKNGADEIVEATQKAASSVRLSWKESNALVMQRGRYVVAAGLDSAESSTEPVALHGDFIDLFDAGLTESSTVTLSPGSRNLLLDLRALDRTKPQILAASGKVSDEQSSRTRLSFRLSGIEGTQGAVRLLTPRAPKHVSVNGVVLDNSAIDYNGRTLFLHVAVSAVPVDVAIEF
ncbi:MAG TPA: hypothetical protein VGG95_05565 [Edaphobacter sp.]